MTLKEIIKDFLSKVVLPIFLICLLFFIFTAMFTEDGVTDYVYVWLACGVPFGIHRMWFWLIPHGHDLGTTVGILALNIIIGSLIGGFIIIWRLLCVVWYLIVTIYRIVIYNSISNRMARKAVYETSKKL